MSVTVSLIQWERQSAAAGRLVTAATFTTGPERVYRTCELLQQLTM